VGDFAVRTLVTAIGMAGWLCSTGAPVLAQSRPTYRIQQLSPEVSLEEQFGPDRVTVLELLNRADREHLTRLTELVVPETWQLDERSYAVLPSLYLDAAPFEKLLVVHLPGQMFGAYEHGSLVRWGPVSSGGPASPTPSGLFHLTWRSVGHASSVDPAWFLKWYFNFDSADGLAFHEYDLLGRPASHGCIRLLSRDARWLFAWGEGWSSDSRGELRGDSGTPVLIVGMYDVESPPPWRSLTWLGETVELPDMPAAP
jgi:hypothetical protein